MSDNQKFVSINKCAALTGLSRIFIREMCRSGQAPCFRVGSGQNASYKINYPKFCELIDGMSENGVS